MDELLRIVDMEIMIRDGSTRNHELDVSMASDGADSPSSARSNSYISNSAFSDSVSWSSVDPVDLSGRVDSSTPKSESPENSSDLDPSSGDIYDYNQARFSKKTGKRQYVAHYVIEMARSGGIVDAKTGAKTHVRCLVCGDRTTGRHYGILTCEACKGFFRRSVKRKRVYRCHKNGRCNIVKSTRNICQACRYQSCLRAGLDVNKVLDELELERKRQIVELNKLKNKKKPMMRHSTVDSVDSFNNNDRTVALPTHVLTDYNNNIESIARSFRNTVVNFGSSLSHKDFEWKTRETSESICDITFSFLATLYRFSFNSCPDFLRSLPGMNELTVSEKIALNCLDCCLELYCLKLFCSYNLTTSSIVLPSGLSINERNLLSPPLSHAAAILSPVFRFCADLSRFALDEMGLALFAALIVYDSERRNLSRTDVVENHQSTILQMFQYYISSAGLNKHSVYWTKLLMKLNSLRLLAKTLITIIESVHEYYTAGLRYLFTAEHGSF